ARTTAISADVTTVAFTDPATGIVSGATTDGVNDQLYIWSRTNNTTTGLSAGKIVLASHQAGDTSTGTTIDSTQFLFGFTGDTPVGLSSNGNEIVYYDPGSDLVSNQAGTASVLNVFLYNV